MKKIIILLVTSFIFLLAAPQVFAATQGKVFISGIFSFGSFWTFADAIQPLVNPAFAIAGTIVFIYFIVGAFRFVTSNGDKNIIASAREEIYHGIIGFILLILLFLVMRYLPAFFLGPGSFSLIKF